MSVSVEASCTLNIWQNKVHLFNKGSSNSFYLLQFLSGKNYRIQFV